MVFSGISNNLTYTASSDYGSGGTYSGSDDSDSTAKVENTFSTTTPGDNSSYKASATSTTASASSYISCSADASASSSRSIYGGAMSNTGTSAMDIQADFKDNNATQIATGGTADAGTVTVYGGDASAYNGGAVASTSYSIPWTPEVFRTVNPSINTGATASASANASTSAYAYADASTSVSSYTYGGAIANQNNAKLGKYNR